MDIRPLYSERQGVYFSREELSQSKAKQFALVPVSSAVYSRKMSNSQATAGSRNCRTWLSAVSRPSSFDARA